MATSPTLIESHYVVLRTVRLDPPALPTPQGVAAGVSVLSPVSQVGVTAVVSNLGSVDEPRVSVRITLADQASGARRSHTGTTGAVLGGSVALPTVAFDVKPGTTYVLTVACPTARPDPLDGRPGPADPPDRPRHLKRPPRVSTARTWWS